jgi:hypothetical protein
LRLYYDRKSGHNTETCIEWEHEKRGKVKLSVCQKKLNIKYREISQQVELLETKDYFLIALACFIIFLFVRIDYAVMWKDEPVYAGLYGWDPEPISLDYYFFFFPIWWVSFAATIGFLSAGLVNHFLERIRKKREG